MDEISRMLAEHQCQKLSDLYCRHLDYKDPEAFAAIFTEDAVYKPAIQPRPIVGRDNIRQWCHDYPSTRFLRHLSTNQIVEVLDETRAKGTSYAITFREPDPRPDQISGRSTPRAVVEYVDTYRKTGDGWKIATRFYNIDFLDSEETNRPKRTNAL